MKFKESCHNIVKGTHFDYDLHRRSVGEAAADDRGADVAARVDAV